jgi:hypothetical protein
MSCLTYTYRIQLQCKGFIKNTSRLLKEKNTPFEPRSLVRKIVYSAVKLYAGSPIERNRAASPRMLKNKASTEIAEALSILLFARITLNYRSLPANLRVAT